MFSNVAPTLLVRLCSIRCCQHGRIFNFWAISRRQYLSSDSARNNQKRSEDLYDKGIVNRQHQARKSVFVQVSSSDVQTHHIERAIAKVSSREPSKILHCPQTNAFIVELETQTVVRLLLKRGAFHATNGKNVVPVRSRLLRLNEEPGKDESTATMSQNPRNREEELRDKLVKANSIVEQMEELWSFNAPTEVGVRKRFLLALLVEHCLRGLFPSLQLRPFGSSVNGFGSDSSDLDLQLILNTHPPADVEMFQFFTKERQEQHQRVFVQKTLEVLSRMLDTFLPEISHIELISHARVPIVKFRHDSLDLQCDISLQDPPTGCYMSKLFSTFSDMDRRVPVLMSSLRAWSQATRLHYSIPGAWFSNFQFLVLGLFYLQRIQLLPPISKIRAQDLGCGHQFQLRQGSVAFWKGKTAANKQTLEDLLAGFFDFYANFDFAKHALDLESGELGDRKNKEKTSIFARNPMELQHENMLKGVNRDYTKRLVHYCQVASGLMAESKVKEKNFGLLKLCDLGRYAGSGSSVVEVEHRPDRRRKIIAAMLNSKVAGKGAFRFKSDSSSLSDKFKSETPPSEFNLKEVLWDQDEEETASAAASNDQSIFDEDSRIERVGRGSLKVNKLAPGVTIGDLDKYFSKFGQLRAGRLVDDAAAVVAFSNSTDLEESIKNGDLSVVEKRETWGEMSYGKVEYKSAAEWLGESVSALFNKETPRDKKSQEKSMTDEDKGRIWSAFIASFTNDKENAPTISEKAPTVSKKAATNSEKAPTISERPPTILEKPPTILEKPPTKSENTQMASKNVQTVSENARTISDDAPTEKQTEKKKKMMKWRKKKRSPEIFEWERQDLSGKNISMENKPLNVQRERQRKRKNGQDEVHRFEVKELFL